MAFLKAIRCVMLLLALCSILDKVETSPRLNIAKELTGTHVSPIHARAKRDTDFDYALEVVVRVSDVTEFCVWLEGLKLPLELDGDSTTLTNIIRTTTCKRNKKKFLCSCNENFTWSKKQCDDASKSDKSPSSTDICECITQNLSLENGFCQQPIKSTGSFTMDITFEKSFNNNSSSMYQTISQSIKNIAGARINDLVSANLNSFRSGSTIADYVITATSFRESDLEDFRKGIFSELGRQFRVIFTSSEPLNFSSDVAISEEPLNITCGPPPADLNFKSSIARWEHNGKPISNSTRRRSISVEDGESILIVYGLLSSDKGQYVCFLDDGIVFRQSKTLTVQEKPAIRVNAIRKAVRCEDAVVTITLNCSVQSLYKVEMVDELNNSVAEGGSTIQHDFRSDCKNLTTFFTCRVKNNSKFKVEIMVIISKSDFDCVNDSTFGNGYIGRQSVGQCRLNEVGNKLAQCTEDREWKILQDGCILKVIQDLLFLSQFLDEESLPEFLDRLENVTVNFEAEVVNSTANIRAIVLILSRVANAASVFSIALNQTLMEDILVTVGILTIDAAKQSWDNINANITTNGSLSEIPRSESTSSVLLFSIETLTNSLTNESFNIFTDSILLNRTTFTDSFSADLNSSVEINIPQSNRTNITITVITFDSMDNVLPARNESNSTDNAINGRVVLVRTRDNNIISDVSFTFDTINRTLASPQCVFWNFSLFNGLGGWDGEGCELVVSVNETVTCNCSHLTSFSILMSPFIPQDLAVILSYITYIGVSISIASLIICLIIEAITWRKIRRNSTSFLRHVTIVNIAVSLLIADIWFIIAAAIADTGNVPACRAATFFVQLFYLALFFWMFASALLLLYRIVSVFGDISDNVMLAVGFSLGYGAPIIITTITIAVTAPKEAYIHQTGACFLNWYESKALLAFVIPALLIVMINICILLVVLYKMLRHRGIGESAQEGDGNVLLFIFRALAVLTPFFGLTWSLGVGTMVDPKNEGIHVSFTVFNSLQGLFVLVFGTLLDKTVRSELGKHTLSTSGTRTTSTGISSSGGLGFFRRRGRDGYNMPSSASNT